jgi:hypothetical protein
MSITKIAEVVVGSGGAASIDFTSIPGTYTDLLLVLSTRCTNSAVTGPIYMSFNGATSNRSARTLNGTGSSVGSYTISDNFLFDTVGNTATSNTFNSSNIYIPNYAGSANKSFSVDTVNENNVTASNQVLEAGLWSSTASIASISITSTGFNLMQYSTATLYGVTKGSSGGVTVS